MEPEMKKPQCTVVRNKNGKARKLRFDISSDKRLEVTLFNEKLYYHLVDFSGCFFSDGTCDLTKIVRITMTGEEVEEMIRFLEYVQKHVIHRLVNSNPDKPPPDKGYQPPPDPAPPTNLADTQTASSATEKRIPSPDPAPSINQSAMHEPPWTGKRSPSPQQSPLNNMAPTPIQSLSLSNTPCPSPPVADIYRQVDEPRGSSPTTETLDDPLRDFLFSFLQPKEAKEDEFNDMDALEQKRQSPLKDCEKYTNMEDDLQPALPPDPLLQPFTFSCSRSSYEIIDSPSSEFVEVYIPV